MVASTHRCPPPGTEREDQSGGRDETGQDRGTAGLVGSGSSGIHGIVDPPLCLLLGDARPLAHQLGETSTIFRRDRATGNRAGEYAGHFRPGVLAAPATAARRWAC